MPAAFWLDKLAEEVLERERRLGRNLTPIRVESGIGASGFPHIGSVGDSLRAYGVKLGIEALGRPSEMIAFSDDRDGLRKVPAGVPEEYRKYLGMPVTDIPDPWGCHGSYGEHMSGLLVDALEKLDLDFRLMTAREAYRSGMLDDQIHAILTNRDKVEAIVREEVGSSKPEGWIPYWPVCEKCGRMYTTRVIKVIPEERKVVYVCDQEFKGIKGCGHVGEASYARGEGKLPWMWGEFAARWAALKISFEPHGKDIADSFRVNSRIAREVLGFEPPYTIRYEMFLDASGTKISKSKGNVLTPQQWLRYAPKESLRMLMFKRYRGARRLAVEKIPTYVADFERNLRTYWNPRGLSERDKLTIRRLVEYSFMLGEVPRPPPFSFSSLLNVISILPHRTLGREEVRRMTAEMLSKYYGVSEAELLEDPIFLRWFDHAANFVSEVGWIQPEGVKLEPEVLMAVEEFTSRLESGMSGEDVQNLAHEVAERTVGARKFFSSVYQLLVGAPRGPRLGPLIERIGVERAKEWMRASLARERGELS